MILSKWTVPQAAQSHLILKLQICNDKTIKEHSRRKQRRQINKVIVVTITLITIILVRTLTMAMSMKMQWESLLIGVKYRNRERETSKRITRG